MATYNSANPVKWTGNRIDSEYTGSTGSTTPTNLLSVVATGNVFYRATIRAANEGSISADLIVKVGGATIARLGTGESTVVTPIEFDAGANVSVEASATSTVNYSVSIIGIEYAESI